MDPTPPQLPDDSDSESKLPDWARIALITAGVLVGALILLGGLCIAIINTISV